MFWWPILFIGFAVADDMSAEQYCFKSPKQSLNATHNLRAITIASDVVTLQAECFTVKMLPHRRELIQSYIKRIDPAVQVSFSSAEITHPPCELKVEKIRKGNTENLSGELNTYPTVTATESTSSGTDVMTIQTLKNFELNINQEVILGVCRHISSDRYEITLEVRKDPIPYPPLPPGVIVVQNAPQPDQKTSRLQTTLQLTKGSRIEVGGVVRDLREKDHSLDLGSNAEFKKTEAQNTEQVFLSLQ